jgi:3-dehydrosphinganine reductase
MDTPGYEEENKSKPNITKEIEGSSATCSPKDAARYLLSGMLNERYWHLIRYYITNDIVGELARTCVHGGQPRPNTTIEILASPLLNVVFVIWSWVTDMDIRNHFKKQK